MSVLAALLLALQWFFSTLGLANTIVILLLLLILIYMPKKRKVNRKTAIDKTEKNYKIPKTFFEKFWIFVGFVFLISTFVMVTTKIIEKL